MALSSRRRRLGSTFVLLVGTVACFEPDPTASLDRQNQDLIYGVDDRRDVYELEADLWRALALESAPALIPEPSLQRRADGTIGIVSDEIGALGGLCPGERFREQTTVAVCSGVLVDDNLVLTAGHCASAAATCADQRWVFGYALTSPVRTPLLDERDVYRCRSVPLVVDEKRADESDWDFAFVELDRAVLPPRRPALFGSRPATATDPVAVIGYPSGTPVKVDRGAEVREGRPGLLDYFSLTSDTFEGNSGSGVFDAQGRVVGVFVRGGADFELGPDAGCLVPRQIDIDPSEAASERASHAGPAVAALCASGWSSQRLCGANADAGALGSGAYGSYGSDPGSDPADGCVLPHLLDSERRGTPLAILLATCAALARRRHARATQCRGEARSMH
jgi:hypothetical protein